MTIVVKFTAQLKKEAGTAQQEFELADDDNLTALLARVSQAFNDKVRDMIFDDNGVFRQSIIIVQNGTQVGIDDPIALKQGDEILLMSPIAGG